MILSNPVMITPPALSPLQQPSVSSVVEPTVATPRLLINSLVDTLPLILPVICKAVAFYLLSYAGDIKCKKILIGHEHGTKNFKCHIQGYIEFEKRINKIIKPGIFTVPFLDPNSNYEKKDIEYLIMFQSSKNSFALQNYIKKKDEVVKDNKFMCFDYEDKTIKDIFQNADPDYPDNSNPCLNEYDLLLTSPNLDIQQLQDIAIKSNDNRIKQFVLVNSDKILKFSSSIRNFEIPEFKWNFPSYIDQFLKDYNENKIDQRNLKNIDLERFYKNFKIWFDKYCINNDPLNISPSGRKKGLFIYGDRGIGKTFLIKSLVMKVDEDEKDNPFLVYCRGTLAWERFKDKLNTAQLILLDDCQFLAKQKEIFKALIVGQSTNFKSNYIDNEYWNRSCPCVVLSNNIYVLKYVLTSKEFNEDLYILSIKDYIGPPGTQPERKSDIYLDEDTKNELEKLKEKELDKKLKFNNKYFNNMFN